MTDLPPFKGVPTEWTVYDEALPNLGWTDRIARRLPLWVCRLCARLRIMRRTMGMRLLVAGIMPGVTATPRKWFHLEAPDGCVE